MASTRGALAPNGCICFVPGSANQALCVSRQGEMELVGPELPLHESCRWKAGGVLAPTGCAPCSARNVRCIDADGDVKLMESEPVHHPPGRQHAIALALNGCMVVPPWDGARALCIDA